MKKYSFVFLLTAILAMIIYLNADLNKIKTVYGTEIKQVYYSETLNVSGEFESMDTTNIMLSYPVCIKEVYVKENSYVNQGQALFSIDKERMINYLTGEIDSELLEQLDYENLSRLAYIDKSTQSGIYTLPDTIYASAAGVVSQINVYPGAIAMPNRHLAVINHTDNIVAKFTLSQLDYGKISVGDSVSITPVAFQNSRYKGIISQQSAVIKKQTTAVGNKVVVDVFATITNPDKKVSAGLQINGVVQSTEPVLINALDYTYINQDQDGQFVFILNNGLAEKVYIETGIESENYTEIITEFPQKTIFIDGAELKEGDRVILKQ